MVPVDPRIGPCMVRTAWSPVRVGSVFHPPHLTGRIRFSPSMSSAVATLAAIMQTAFCGVRMLIACQFRWCASAISLLKSAAMNCS